MIASNYVSESLQETLNSIALRQDDRKDEVVDMLSDEQPSKSRFVEMSYLQCTWWEGCYYCQDEAKRWYRVKCFI
jgi:asparagine synthetase B (glutamine-hydrolysing)